MSQISDWSLVETADAVAARKVSSVEVVQTALKRIEARQPVLNCFIRVDADRALAEARAADAAQAIKRSLGPLHGVPLSHKDMYYRAGLPVTCGSAIRRHFVPGYKATALQRLDAAGAVSIGALNMSEFANGPTGHNVHYGPTHNPWNADHITGGSSTGSGAAVAGRVVYGSLGSDTGGSIRLPAGICGIYGIKPTQGRVSRHGVMGLSFSLDTVGPLARTARDCARLLKVIAGADANDPTAANAPVDDYEAALDGGVSGTRIAVATNHFWDGMDSEIGGLLEAALGVYSKLGATEKRITAPHLELIRGLGNIVTSSEFCALHDDWLRQVGTEASISLGGSFLRLASRLVGCRHHRQSIDKEDFPVKTAGAGAERFSARLSGAGLGLSFFLGWTVDDAGHIAIFFIVEDDRVINFTFNFDGCDLLVRLFYRFDRWGRFLCVLKFPILPANCRGRLDNDLVGGTADRTSDRISGKVVETAAT